MWKIHILLYSFLIPKEFNLTLGVLNFSVYRVLLLLLAPWVIWKLLSQRKFKWQIFDTVAILVCTWPFIALLFSSSIGTAIEGGGVLFLETFVPFFTARLLIYKYKHLRSISHTLLLVAMIMAISAIPEALTGQPFIHNIASLITGNSFEFLPEKRLGIWRSYGPTDHPIILGTICAVALPLGIALIRSRRFYLTATSFSFLGVIASASSGPLLAMVAQAGLHVWSSLTRGNRQKWWLLIFLVIAAYIFVDILSNRDPFRVMFSYLLFNEHNGYVRYNMWLNSFFLIGQSFGSFFVGYGFSTEMMSLIENQFFGRLMSISIDSYWMVILVRYGAPMLFLSALMVTLILRANVKSYRRHKLTKQRKLIQAWLISAVSLSLVACTVHFWGSTASLFFIVLGCTCMGKRRTRSIPASTSSEKPTHSLVKQSTAKTELN